MVRTLLQAALIVLAGWWVFSPALQGGWLWDDDGEITQNLLLRDPAGFWKIWFAPAGPDYFPLKTTVQWLQWRLWQEHTPGYHLTNLGLHLLSALLLWRLLGKLGLRLAWLGGLLFAVHPVAVESVAWIAELKNALSLPPLLLAMCAWLDYDASGRRADYLRAVLLFLAAMLCKSSVVMFPAVLLLHAWWKRDRIARTDLKAGAAFFAISLGLGLVTVWFQHHRAMEPGIPPPGGFLSRLAGAGPVPGFYFSKCVFPVQLLPAYPRWTVDPGSPALWLPWLVTGGLLGVLWTRRTTWGRHALFGGGFFLVNLLPVLGLIPMSYLRIAWVADHFVYLPLAGLIGLAVAGAERISFRLSSPLRLPAGAGAVMILGLLVFQAHRQAGFFRDQETLWGHTLRRHPDSWPAHYNLGFALFQAGRVPEALEHYQEALRIIPDSADAHNNLANALFRMGRTGEAVGHYEKALSLQPGSAETHYNLGNALLQAERVAEAEEHYREAARLKPGFAEAHYNLGWVLFQSDRLAEAKKEYEQALRIRPDYANARANLDQIEALQNP